MPPKKREKEKEEITKTLKTENNNDDHEQFLQAFEKPTQIYRYLRTRNMLKPIFLYRTLSYMKHRMSRSNKSRKTFKIEEFLDKMQTRLNEQTHPSGYLTLTFLGFFHKNGISQEDPVKVETLLLKICHKKRKDVSCPVNTMSVNTSYVAYNPSEEYPPPQAPTASIPTDNFSLSGHLVKSYHLLLRVNTLSTPSEILSGGEPQAKKRKKADEEKVYGTDLVIYDKQNRCLLIDGDYEFYLDELVPETNSKIAQTLSSWQEVDQEMKDEITGERMGEGPLLKVRLSWSKQKMPQVVEWPTPVPRFLQSVTIQPIGQVSEKNGSGQMSDVTSIVYQFLYNNNSKQQTEASCDMHCPWCSIDCKQLYPLLKHLTLSHPRFTFTLVMLQQPVGSGTGARIDVALNEDYDGSYCGLPRGSVGTAARGIGPSKRTPLSHVIVCHPRRPSNDLREFLHSDDNKLDAQRPYFTGHNRLYHHSTTCLPIFPQEMDMDSEEETDPGWLQKKTIMMIDEFTDVNEGEKELIKMWNLHVMKYGFVGDCQMSLCCQMFLEEKGEELLTKNLYRNFVIHMCNLSDFGLVSPAVVYTTIQKLLNVISDRPDVIRIVKDSCEGHKEQWKETQVQREVSSPGGPGPSEPRAEAVLTPGQRRKPTVTERLQPRQDEESRARRRLSIQGDARDRRKLPSRRKSLNVNI